MKFVYLAPRADAGQRGRSLAALRLSPADDPGLGIRLSLCSYSRNMCTLIPLRGHLPCVESPLTLSPEVGAGDGAQGVRGN